MLEELVQGIVNVLKDSIIKIVLYGSVARGTQESDSDIDIAVFLSEKMDEEAENKLSDIIVDMNLKYNKVFSVVDINNNNFELWRSSLPFYKNIDREGIVLWKAA